MKKKMSKKSRRWFKEFLDHFYEMHADQDGLAEELSRENGKAIRLLRPVKPWDELYSEPPARIVLAFFECLGLTQKLIEIASSRRRTYAYQAFFQDVWHGNGQKQADEKLDEMSDEERGECFSLLFEMTGNMNGLKCYNASISDLIRCSLQVGPAEAEELLLKAISVDRVALSNSVVAKRIASAEIAKDNSFVNKLAKAVTQTRPRRRHDLDDFRYMAEVIDEVEGIETYSIEDIADLCVNTLGVLPPGRPGTSRLAPACRS